MQYGKTIKSTPSDSANDDEFSSSTTKKRVIYGYINKLTGKIYHHAVSQTMSPPWKYDSIVKFHRDSQTVEIRDEALQTPRNACTQVQASNIYINTSGDKCLIYSGCYVFADDIKQDYSKKVIIVQKYARRWLAMQELLRRKKYFQSQQHWDNERLKFRVQLDIDWLKSLNERRLHPKTEEDFILLFSDLQKWWNEKADCINSEQSGSNNPASFWSLVNNEVKRIVNINKKKYLSLQQEDTDLKNNLLHKAAQPKLWIGYKTMIQVEASSTLTGKYFHELYQTLSMKYMSPQDRIVALTSLKNFMQPHRCKLSENLIQLANREIDLLLRNTKSDRLEGLRNRIQNLFWQFAKQPIYNPRMKMFEKNDDSKHVICCASCKRFYALESNSTNETLRKSVSANYFTKCSKCSYIETEAWIRKDVEIYKKLLKILIKEEERRSSISGLIYILQPTDIKHLVEKIWKGESCISGLARKDDLELTRYDFEESWTPWNCLLVTRKEAQVLQVTPYPDTIYNNKFKESVLQKHTDAKVHFSRIPRFLPYIC